MLVDGGGSLELDLAHIGARRWMHRTSTICPLRKNFFPARNHARTPFRTSLLVFDILDFGTRKNFLGTKDLRIDADVAH